MKSSRKGAAQSCLPRTHPSGSFLDWKRLAAAWFFDCDGDLSRNRLACDNLNCHQNEVLSVMSTSTLLPLHTVDLIRKKRDGGTLDARELGFLAAGAASGSIPLEQLSAWLMAAWLRGLSLEERRALTLAMRDSGERLSREGVGAHKPSSLTPPRAAPWGGAVPRSRGRARAHTGGTLDKLESIPGFRTAL